MESLKLFGREVLPGVKERDRAFQKQKAERLRALNIPLRPDLVAVDSE